MEPKLIREVESEEFFETTLDEETEIFERKEKKEKDKVILG